MTNLTITDVPQKIFSKTEYKAEELVKILLQNLDYDVDFEYFSDEEVNELKKSTNGNYDKISKLID